MAEPPSIPFRTTGSRVLHPISVLFNVPLDQVNFAVCQLFALFAAFWFRLYLSPSRAGTVVRHVVITMIGIYVAIFCFGWYSLHIFIEVSLCYCIMTTANVSNIHRYSFVAAMSYLTLCQISRVYIFNYGLLATDFSGPLMIVTQKITSLAFQLHDGLGRKDEELTTEQRRLAVSVRPTLLEYCSYHLNFLGILAGPTSSYKDYIAFIEGNHINVKLIEEHWKQRGYHKFPDPSPLRAVANKTVITFVCLIWFTGVTKNFPISYNADDKFISEACFFWRLCYLFISVHASRPKYYFAWTLADAINNAGGFGFNGLDTNGNLRWDLLSNLNIWNIETATSLKMCLDNWNIQTAAWLKSVCYDRAPYFPTALTFILSALWHGVYPGYYFTFLTAILITLTARAMRSNFRHYFLSSKRMKIVYDIVTWACTQLALCYISTPFLLLAVEPTIKFYKGNLPHPKSDLEDESSWYWNNSPVYVASRLTLYLYYTFLWALNTVCTRECNFQGSCKQFNCFTDKSMYFHFHILCALVLPVLAMKNLKCVEKVAQIDRTSLNTNSSNTAPNRRQSKKEQ